MNANEIDFGIEFETTLPSSDATPIGDYHHGVQVSWLPQGWKAERDSSIRPTCPKRKGCEFISLKLRGYEGLQEIERAIDAINEHGARVKPLGVLSLVDSLSGESRNCESGRMSMGGVCYDVFRHN